MGGWWRSPLRLLHYSRCSNATLERREATSRVRGRKAPCLGCSAEHPLGVHMTRHDVWSPVWTASAAERKTQLHQYHRPIAGGAGSGVLRRAARNRWPREAREVARQALRPGCEELAQRIRKATARRCRTAGAEGDGSAAPRPKTATVERREASVPRYGTQGASQAPGVSRHDTPNGCLARTRTFLGAPPLY